MNIIWSELAYRSALEIKRYLLSHFSEAEVAQFEMDIRKFERTISKFPKIYPVRATNKSVRQAAISRNTLGIYRIGTDFIEIVLIADGRANIPIRLQEEQ